MPPQAGTRGDTKESGTLGGDARERRGERLPGLLDLGAPGALLFDHLRRRPIQELRIRQLLIEALELGGGLRELPIEAPALLLQVDHPGERPADAR